ncbi:MAG: universal stress protein [Blastocatellia bacterium]|nr:MAG: universal stress protein [Blastocatellia bacterium]
MRVLLAVDGSPCSDAAIEEVAERPWPEGTIIRVLSAFEMPLPPTPEAWALPPRYVEEIEEAGRENARKIVTHAVDQLTKKISAGVTVESKFVVGPPKNVILEEAESWDADLIVLGSHGYNAWERFLLGSVSQGVVSHAKCSVEVARMPKKVA